MDLIIILIAVFCIMTGLILGFLHHAVPRLILILTRLADATEKQSRVLDSLDTKISAVQGCLDVIRINVIHSVSQLGRIENKIDQTPGLPPGVYEETAEGRLVPINKVGNNASGVPGDILSAAGLRASDIQPR